MNGLLYTNYVQGKKSDTSMFFVFFALLVYYISKRLGTLVVFLVLYISG